MHRAIRRLLTLVMGLGSALTAPSLSLAHGHAHHEAAEHSADHKAHVADHGGDRAAVSPHDHGTHDHLRVEATNPVRGGFSVHVMHGGRVTIQPAATIIVVEAAAPVPNASPPPLPDRTPDQSRAPPAL